MTKALILIDIQNDYFAGGKMPLEGADAAADNAAHLLAAFRARGWPIVHIQHLSTRPGATFFLPDTEGVQIHASVAPRAGELVLQKNYPNSFRATALEATLREQGVTELVLAGMMTHMCVDTTVRAAFDLGFRNELAHDACATRALRFGDRDVAAADVHASFIAALGGLFAKTLSARDLAAALQ